jgi:hypothetical protein
VAVRRHVAVPSEEICDVAAAPPCTPGDNVVACVVGCVEVELSDDVAPLLLEQLLPKVAVGRPVGAAALLRR